MKRAAHSPPLLVFVALVVLPGCRKDAVKGARTGETPAPDTSGVLAAPETDLAPMPGPGRGRLAAAVAAGEACAGCHDDEARSWARSRHHLAATNGAFAEAFTAEPAGFCQDCHAPEAAPGKAPSPEVRALGVGCVTCHVTEEGVVLAATCHDGVPVGAPRGAERAPHRTPAVGRVRAHRSLRFLPRVPLPWHARGRGRAVHADHRPRARPLRRGGHRVRGLPHAADRRAPIPRLQHGPRSGLAPGRAGCARGDHRESPLHGAD